MKSLRLEVRLDTDLHAKLDELAKLRGVKASVVVRRSILDAHRAAFPDAPRTRCKTAVPDAPVTPPDTVAAFHEHLWGSPPSPVQQQLYDAHGRGYVTGATEEQVTAVVTMALFIGPLRPYDPTNIPAQPDASSLLPITIVAPPDMAELVMQRSAASLAASRGKPLAATVAETLRRMRIGLPADWSREPRIWVAVGVSVDEATPTWMRKRLVETL
jgi:hypothetical protein